MTTRRLDTEGVLQSIVGKKSTTYGRVENTQPQPPDDKLLKTTFYIKKSQRKALKIRAATSDKPEEKDPSAIIRTAIDKYLAENGETKVRA